jgi:2-polyprenyl-6-methoxyphenol hydroxylase-like FAD-dependent oxidoreductase
LMLARSGVDVIVAEKDAVPSVKYKGELLQPKSLDIINRLGLYQKVRSDGFPIRTTSITEYKGNRVIGEIQYQYERINHPFNEALMIPHETLKRIIRSHAEQYPSFHFLNPAKCNGFREEGERKKLHLFRIKSWANSKSKRIFLLERKEGYLRFVKALAFS